MIVSFRDKTTGKVYSKQNTKRIHSDIARKPKMKLDLLHAATELEDLRWPPGNRIEELPGDRVGQHSLRINDQWRLCFRWCNGNAEDVEICDYH